MPPTTTERTNVRREAIGQADDTTLIADGDIDWYWDEGGAESVLLTAALVCEMLAARSGGTEIPIASVGGLSINRSVFPAELRRRAMELRRRYLLGDAVTTASVGMSSAVQAVWADHEDAWTDEEAEI
jgi:hypothetical protein